jgi:hypothetical protein
MVVRRKYKTGGRVPISDEAGAAPVGAPADEPVVLNVEPEPDITPEHEPEDDAVRHEPEDDAVLRSIMATQRAEMLARDPVAATINSWPISDRQKAFLNANRELIDPANAAVIHAARQEAASQGILPDTAEEESAILGAVHGAIQQRQEAAIANVRSQAAPILPPAAKPALPVTPILPPIMPPRKATVPMSAPVTRDVPSASGRPAGSQNQITLTPEERAVARNSFGAIKGADGKMVDLTIEQKEMMYAQNKARMLRMRANGTLNDQ